MFLIYFLLVLFIYPMLIKYSLGMHMTKFLPQCRSNVNYTQYVQSSIRTDLFCPRKFDHKYCEFYYKKRACACNAVPIWIMEHSTVLPLKLEYIGLKGASVLFYKDKGTQYFQLIHRNGIMSKMPENYCSYPTTVQIILSGNLITFINRLSCLKELDLIDLSYNRIAEVSNGTFRTLHKLRVIDLSYNRIYRIEPFTFFQNGLNPLIVNISDNSLKELDFSNVFMLEIFCLAIYSNNNISSITNELGYTMNSVGYERSHAFGGFIDLSDNNISFLPDPFIFGLKSMFDYGLLIHTHYWVHFNRNNFVCDCNMALTLQAAIPIMKRFHMGTHPFGIVCSSPPEMTSFEINNLDDEKLLKFKCKSRTCPHGCSCVYISLSKQIVIDCSGAGNSQIGHINMSFTSWNLLFSEIIRDFEEAEIHFRLSENSLKGIPNLPDLIKRTTYLDISRNKIQNLQRVLLETIKADSYLNFSYNSDLKSLPNIISRFHFDNVDLTGLMLDCTCDDVNKMYKWLPDFIQSSDSKVIRTVHCNINGKIINARIVTSKYLGCEGKFILENMVILVALSLLLLSVVLLTLIFVFRFELFIVYRKIKQKEVVAITCMHDIYISMENENEILLRWVLHQFCPSLENRGYKVYLPPRDMDGGCFREEVTRQIIKCSRCVVVFLTASFANGDDDWMALEWRVAWQQYKMNYSKKLIIVNYDQMRYGDVDDYVLRKYLRWGTCLDFCTRRKFLQSFITEIGKPCTTSNCFDKVQKTKFNSLHIMKGI